jgi:hypothetical protein
LWNPAAWSPKASRRAPTGEDHIQRAVLPEPLPEMRYRNHRMVELNVRGCVDFEKSAESHDPPFQIVNVEVWFSRDEIEFLR